LLSDGVGKAVSGVKVNVLLLTHLNQNSRLTHVSTPHLLCSLALHWTMEDSSSSQSGGIAGVLGVGDISNTMLLSFGENLQLQSTVHLPQTQQLCFF